jgi:hypothetical protein
MNSTKMYTILLIIAISIFRLESLASQSQSRETSHIFVRAAQASSSIAKTYAGSITGAKQWITMRLVRKGSNLEGNYQYENSVNAIRLVGSVAASGQVRLEEFSGGRKTGVFVGVFRSIHYDEVSEFAGNWSKPNGSRKMKFIFKEMDEQLSQARLVFRHSEVKKKYYEISASYPQFLSGSGPGWNKTNATLQKFTEKNNAFAPGFIEDANAEKPNLPYTRGIDGCVLVANDSFISVKYNYLEYSSAMQPSVGTEWLMLDPITGEKITIKQFFKLKTDFSERLNQNILVKWREKTKKYPDLQQPIDFTPNLSPEHWKYGGVSRTGFIFGFGGVTEGIDLFDVTVPFADLEDLLDPNGPVKFLRK